MRTIALLLACLAGADHGRRVQKASDRMQDSSYVQRQSPQEAGNTPPSSSSLVALEQSQSNAGAVKPNPSKSLAMLLLAYNHPTAAFDLAHRHTRPVLGHGNQIPSARLPNTLAQRIAETRMIHHDEPFDADHPDDSILAVMQARRAADAAAVVASLDDYDNDNPDAWKPSITSDWRDRVLNFPEWNRRAWAVEWPPLVERLDDELDKMQHAEQFNRNSPLTQGVWAPQLEEHKAVPMHVSAGQLPDSLSGVFLRIGPNPANPASKKKYNVFDGDGMIHSMRIKDGKAWYSNSFVQTKRYRVEQKLNKEYFTRLGEISGTVGIAKAVLVMGRKEAWHNMTALDNGPANTHTIIFDGDVYALAEGNFPFEVLVADDGSITSEGFTTFGGELDFPFSAHPKVDERKQQLVFHGYSVEPYSDGPKYKLGVRSAGKSTLDSYTPIEISGLSFNHDMAITEHFAVLLDSSIRFDLMGVMDDHLMFFDEGHHLRLGLQPRSASKDETIWFEAPVAMAIVHVINAFEENGEVVLQAPATYNFKTGMDFTTDVDEGQNEFKIFEFRMDLDACRKSNIKDRRIRVTELRGAHTYHTAEFPRTREDRMGYPTRFAYTATSEGGTDHGGFDFRGLIKFDFKEMNVAKRINFPGKCIGGDPMFIARGEEEDDGFLSVIVYDPEKELSTLNIYDAHTFDEAPVAVLDCPFRVPMGFHANWMTEAQLQQHLAKHSAKKSVDEEFLVELG